MDEFYDYAKAKGAIQMFTEESIKTNPLHMSGITQRGAVLVKKQGEEDMEELVFTCNGVIADADLPPVIRSPSAARDKVVTMAQSITVTGLGCHTFDDTIAMLQEIRLTVEREFKSGMLDKWNPTTYRGFPAFTLSNRYFRTQRDGSQHEEVTFSKDVDPVGILQRLARNDLIHTEENEVQYFKSHVDEEGKRRYQRARPQLFRMGDIVEIQCSIIIVKGKGIKHRMKLVLRVIALLDCEIALDAKRKMSKSVTMEEPRMKRLKRKIGYGEEEVEEDEGSSSKQARESQIMDESR
ncbi:hypothetical protein EV421DRAFT_1910923 [Armillaria borealis]|uniref:Uncharacterized protein n=1 Tax=Armillaria borealis TaxID=47425 RepID=A0AA39IXS2_9AGAR|nr:hypothetical protein EV421DRAFT_1910923 [Armillaria borealis]